MADENEFFAVALSAPEEIMRRPLSVRRGAALLYLVTIDNSLSLTVNPKSPARNPCACHNWADRICAPSNLVGVVSMSGCLRR